MVRQKEHDVWSSVSFAYIVTEYYTEGHLHCFLRKHYSSWFVTEQVP